MEALIFRRFLNDNQLTKSKLEVYLQGAHNSINAHYNIDFNGRAVVGDDPYNINDHRYGNANVIGPKKTVPTTELMCAVSLLPAEIMTMATEGFLITPN